MVTEGPIGERIRIYRQRRGLSQKELAHLVGRSESWLSQVERGIRSVDRLSVLVDVARVLKTDVETLAGYRMAYAPNGQPELEGLEDIRQAMSAYAGLGLSRTPTSSVAEIASLTTEVHQRYQAADYAAAARILPGLITASDAVVSESGSADLRAALSVQSQAYVAAAKLVTKIGDGQLAWIAADRAVTAAMRADSDILKAMAAYQVACAFLKTDRIDQAEHVAITTAENFADDSPDGLSVQGALFLIGAVIAGRRSDRPEATDRLRRAQYLADALGYDGNHGWTAFGPTNVAIHQISAAAELGDAKLAIARAEDVETDGLPDGLRSRRAQVFIDTAWAYSQHRDDAAVVVNLMEAERTAPQALRYNVIVREMLRELLKRERRSATPGLRALAKRSGVLH
ncbi:transcriptional regulator with XRE-family HTH domain [Saccharopolyspora erythraea NRRL 2338]|uniref:Transcriptional regulator, XRE family n=2 Tax=Saccharopolyspora erythraea TaxID=1836 RepID=A4F8U7_SACEN|nr:helix-turn-helix domain-containing protein [Saccharopolyspora erythraea]EQD86776.1 XRE family transcriptional regulator [Saccharopolyspora erythraea D]PFG94267.1 transcriptional regulator with XRE-family HTH domain [Saccharopolyspora erythraea NRRL 2338]QRK91037.1 helix-turn-helix domain-containing protein [Saccharopolyspora erythraea]CAM00472.1 transcriptional regulator, XRE family [Saccharopolyspora erythraea NRRL 2338]